MFSSKIRSAGIPLSLERLEDGAALLTTASFPRDDDFSYMGRRWPAEYRPHLLPNNRYPHEESDMKLEPGDTVSAHGSGETLPARHNEAAEVSAEIRPDPTPASTATTAEPPAELPVPEPVPVPDEPVVTETAEAKARRLEAEAALTHGDEPKDTRTAAEKQADRDAADAVAEDERIFGAEQTSIKDLKPHGKASKKK